jgi:hypothetical protein
MGLGALTAFAGLITWLSAYAGVDDWRRIELGVLITGFGITWLILGYLLQTLARQRRPPQ